MDLGGQICYRTRVSSLGSKCQFSNQTPFSISMGKADALSPSSSWVPGCEGRHRKSPMSEDDVVIRAGASTSLSHNGRSEDRIRLPMVAIDGVAVRGGGRGGVGISRRTAEVHSSNIEAVEVSPSAAGLPVKCGGMKRLSGATLIWTTRLSPLSQ